VGRVELGVRHDAKGPGQLHQGLAAGGFWVDDFVRMGTGRELSALAKGIDAKYEIVR
jgi:hypothetical protein